ncbi:hypothetical protein E2C01_044969 [Portunus trituberculatus]|uniref:Uncharacterized protein n=1 Tax=Portunus trituberculatus TaxID=210409 RepID=A0A5B7G0V0_PORTR|nr:hypothetical protein [Portunus trituberculatus]
MYTLSLQTPHNFPRSDALALITDRGKMVNFLVVDIRCGNPALLSTIPRPTWRCKNRCVARWLSGSVEMAATLIFVMVL